MPSSRLMYTTSSGSHVTLLTCFEPSITREPSLFRKGSFSSKESNKKITNLQTEKLHTNF